jgi:hypothetical protein
MSSGYSLWLKYLSRQTVSEIINDSDSEECTEILVIKNFSQHLCFSDSSTSSSEEEISLPLEPRRGCKGTLRAELKQTSSDFELEWSEEIESIDIPAFSGLPQTNEIFSIMEDSSPIQNFQKLFW